ncbi:flagellar biosynthesis protein [bacterium]|nr:MAG: flagellar biosynthesis protein [bacterium]
MNVANTRLQALADAQYSPAPSRTPAAGPSFADALKGALDTGDLKVSGHAQSRLNSRGIEMDGAAWGRVKEGVDRAAAKGARESLVLMDDVALVVSVKNRTVITAVDKANLKESVFTNIDSAVIV